LRSIAPGSSLGPSLVHGAWLASSLPAYARFRQALHDPARAQAGALRRVLEVGRDSVLGRKYGMDRARGVDDFRARVPLSRPEDYEPYVAAIRRGEARVLTAEPVERLVPTSGSTAARKLIPYTRGLRREMSQALGAWIVDMFGRRPALLSGPAYWSVSPAMDVAEDSAVPIGFDSDAAYLGRVLEPLVGRALVAPDALRHARPLASFRYATLRLLLACAELRFVSVWHPSFFALLWEQRAHWFERLVRDIHDGTLTPDEPLPLRVATGVSSRLRADPGRARALARLGPGAPAAAVWPRLGLLSAWGDAAAARPFAELAREFSGVEVQRKSLLSTEAFTSIPFAGAYPLAVTAHFIELRGDDGRMALAHEGEPGHEYEIVITTSGGLYRYRTGDRVRVEGLVGKTPSVRFVGRGDQVVDQVGEKLHEAFVVAALAAALPGDPEAGAEAGPSFAMLAPDASAGRAGYTLYVDRVAARAAPGVPGAPDALARLERALRENPHYAYARDLGQLGPLRLFVIHGNAHAAYLEHRAQGRTLGDIKPAALSAASDWSAVFRGAYASEAGAESSTGSGPDVAGAGRTR
jgi:GH3 auxin-responsive promoter